VNTSSKITSEIAEKQLDNIFMAKYLKKAGEKVEEAMHEMKEGKLKTGTGKKVTSKKQAVAIGLSEAREKGAKVPKKKG
jgi:urocanate hydratase